MSLTVAEALELEALRAARVLGGRSGLGKTIKFVDSMEVPDIKPWLRADELLITTAYVIRDDTRALERLVEILAEVRAAGLMLKSARFIGEIPGSVVNLADKLGMPLIEVPKEIPVIDITHSIMKEILSRQARSLEYSNEVRHALTRVELEGTGLTSIAEIVARLVGKDVIITDPDIAALAWAWAPDLAVAKGQPDWLRLTPPQKAGIGESATGGRIPIDAPEACGASIEVRPVTVKGKTLGYVFVRERGRRLTEMELIALEHACTTVALEMVKQQAVDEMRRRMDSDFFDDLLMGNITGREVAMQRASALGYPVGRPATVIVTEVDDFDVLVRERGGESAAQEIKDALRRLIKSSATQRTSKPVIVSRSDSAICLFPASDWSSASDDAMKAAREFQAAVKCKMGFLSVSLGVSYPCSDLLQLAGGYREAREALRISRLIYGKDTIGFIGDLEVYRVFYEHADRPQLKRLLDSLVKPVVDYDGANHTDLLNTLRVLLADSSSRQDAAEKLYIHRNTLAHRLRQIETILGIDLSNPEDRFRLAVAVRIAPFVDDNTP